MEFYALLFAMTAAIAALAGILFLRTLHVGFPIGIGLIYYWSLYGAWWVVTDQLGGESGKRYDYLNAKMFPIELNEHYVWALLLYAVFLILMEMTLLSLVAGRPPSHDETHYRLIPVSHASILVLSTVALVFSVVIMAEQLSSAAELNVSAYAATRGGLGEYHPLFTVHQSLNRIAVYALAIGISVYLAGPSARWFGGRRSIAAGLGYMGLLLATFGYLTVLGNKNELFSALLLGGVFYVMNTVAIGWTSAVPLGMAAFLGIAAIDFLRGLPVLSLLNSENWWEALAWAPEIRSSNEAFAAHFSLYGVFASHAALTYGSSLVALFMSIVPRLYWPDRPEGTYVEYAEILGIYEGSTGQGYTVHHATGWYLNFGLWGLVAGAVLLGTVWAWCFNAYRRARAGDRASRNLLRLIAPAGFVSAIPPLVRAGPDAYKGLIIEAFIIPTLIAWWVTVPWRNLFGHITAAIGVGARPSTMELDSHDAR